MRSLVWYTIMKLVKHTDKNKKQKREYNVEESCREEKEPKIKSGLNFLTQNKINKMNKKPAF